MKKPVVTARLEFVSYCFSAARRVPRWIILSVLMLHGFSSLAQTQTHYQRIKSFGFPELAAGSPSPLIEGSDGVLYGTTLSGGLYGPGTVFKINKDGSGRAVLRHLQSVDGGQVGGPLLEGSDGALYGVAGSNVFKLNKDGTGFTTSRTGPWSFAVPLSEATDGMLYGGGASNNLEAVIRMNRDGTGYSVLYTFAVFAGLRRVIAADDGVLYGFNTVNGGKIFKLNQDGTGFATLHGFGIGSDGNLPNSLIVGTDGKLYGTTYRGGLQERGTVFRLNKDGTGYTILLQLLAGQSTDSGYRPLTLIEGRDGVLYGTTEDNAFAPDMEPWIFKLNKDGSGFTRIYALSASGVEGRQPASLIEGLDGRLYGSTKSGGESGSGVIFSVDKTGANYTRLVNFSTTGNDGTNPEGGLLEASDGRLYGTTEFGGQGNARGTIYKMNKDGSGYTVFSFSATGTGGQRPFAELIEGSDGSLYGSTYLGGAEGAGTIFSITKDLTGLTSLHSFSPSNKDGQNPEGRLLQASDGMLYGTTRFGGTNGEGAIFKLNTNGSGYAILRSFPKFSILGNAEGRTLPTGLIEGTDGALYGTALSGGTTNSGTVFKLNKDGSGFTVLHHFQGGATDGQFPEGELLEASDGVLYGTTRGGGAGARGIVFKLNKDGSGYSIIRHFVGSTDGNGPRGTLLERLGGTLYGLTQSGGIDGRGTVFMLNKDGSGYAILQHFYSTGSVNPKGNMVLASDGMFYGSSYSGGDMVQSSFGTLFKIDPTVLGIAPLTTNVAAGATVNFIATEGTPPYAFTLVTNDSGGSITADGVYTAGLGCATDTVRVTDASNHTATTTIRTDNTAPAINCPANIVIATNVTSVPVTFVVTATDDCTTPPTIVCTPASGSVFLRRTTTVTCWATDSAGNSNSCSFLVTVTYAPPPALAISPASTNVVTGGTVTFTASGGTSPYTLDFATNNSGGSITTNGAYTAGSTPATDTVRVTDAVGSNALASVVVAVSNTRPVVANPIADANGNYGTPFSLTFSANAFTDPDAGQTLTYAAVGMPPGITFTPATRTFDGTPTGVSTYSVTVTATDNGNPALSTSDAFDIVIAKAPLTATASDTNRVYGGLNPAFTGGVSGLVNGDNITAAFSTAAETNSVPGNYPITPALVDPDNKQDNYTVTTNVGVLTVTAAPLTVTAADTNRVYGAPNPAFTGLLLGVVNGDNITATFTTTATLASLPGMYPITPELSDPDGRLINYLTTTNNGTLTITSPPELSFTLGGGSGELFTLSWPASAGDFLLECTENLTPPVIWQAITNGITEGGGIKSCAITNDPNIPGRLYRLRLP